MGAEIATALIIAAATTATTMAISEATKPDVPVPSPGIDPDLPSGADEAAIRARLSRQHRDLSSLRIDPAAGTGIQTGLQIPN